MSGTTILICLVIGIIVGLIGASILRGELTSVQFQKEAAQYEKKESFKLTDRREIYLGKTVEKTEKPKSDSGENNK